MSKHDVTEAVGGQGPGGAIWRFTLSKRDGRPQVTAACTEMHVDGNGFVRWAPFSDARETLGLEHVPQFTAKRAAELRAKYLPAAQEWAERRRAVLEEHAARVAGAVECAAVDGVGPAGFPEA